MEAGGSDDATVAELGERLRALVDVVSSQFGAGCPVLAVAVEEPPAEQAPAVLETVAEVFAGWEALLVAALRREGVDPRQARQAATLVIAAVEGSVALCRAVRSVRPLDDVAALLEAVLADTVAH